MSMDEGLLPIKVAKCIYVVFLAHKFTDRTCNSCFVHLPFVETCSDHVHGGETRISHIPFQTFFDACQTNDEDNDDEGVATQ